MRLPRAARAHLIARMDARLEADRHCFTAKIQALPEDAHFVLPPGARVKLLAVAATFMTKRFSHRDQIHLGGIPAANLGWEVVGSAVASAPHAEPASGKPWILLREATAEERLATRDAALDADALRFPMHAPARRTAVLVAQYHADLFRFPTVEHLLAILHGYEAVRGGEPLPSEEARAFAAEGDNRVLIDAYEQVQATPADVARPMDLVEQHVAPVVHTTCEGRGVVAALREGGRG